MALVNPAADIPGTGDNGIENTFELSIYTDMLMADLYGGLGVQESGGVNSPQFSWSIGKLPDNKVYFYSRKFVEFDSIADGLSTTLKRWKLAKTPGTQLILPDGYKS